MTVPVILQIGIQIIDILAIIHQRGFVYNDLKIDNLVIGNSSDNISKLKIIDFGLVTRYLDPSGNLIP